MFDGRDGTPNDVANLVFHVLGQFPERHLWHMKVSFRPVVRDVHGCAFGEGPVEPVTFPDSSHHSLNGDFDVESQWFSNQIADSVDTDFVQRMCSAIGETNCTKLVATSRETAFLHVRIHLTLLSL